MLVQVQLSPPVSGVAGAMIILIADQPVDSQCLPAPATMAIASRCLLLAMCNHYSMVIAGSWWYTGRLNRKSTSESLACMHHQCAANPSSSGAYQ
jgi:hypothetical protein